MDSVIDEYRVHCANLINRYIDYELVVSKRVGEVAVHFGIDKDKIVLSYIGTKSADNQKRKSTNTSADFTLLYMGYAAQVKGFFEYLNILESLDTEYARNISLRFASKIPNGKVLQRVENMKQKYKSVEIYNGYTHEDFPKITKDVSLGIVPPVWEDNLPQVAIEMISNGIPVLTSDCGGAHELNDHPDFVFTDSNDFEDKIIKIYNNRNLLTEYWNYAHELTTMNMHIEQLNEIYMK